MKFTSEQKLYIQCKYKKNTKLLACAGSGKTRCIIHRIHHLIKNEMYKKNEIMILTFSKFTRDDMIDKIRKYGINNITKKMVSTIDSYAKHIIDPNDKIDVSLLSYKLLGSLENGEKNEILDKLKCVFIDEAQDLNEIQYKIFCEMTNKYGISIHMVGDPSQNIYQFRGSSEKYLLEFDGEVFVLTKNFRSSLPIVNFSKHLRPYKDFDVECMNQDNESIPQMIFYQSENILEEYIINILRSATENNIYDLSDFAILAPTRGKMRGGGQSHGLCLVSNILYRAGIKFKQFYEESNEDVNESTVKYSPKKDHVNIMTYMGSKGLEWKFVILIDAEMCLINKRSFDENKHISDHYLLYVACSRAIDNMCIFSKYYYKNGALLFKTNPWFEHVPEKLYEIDKTFNDFFSFPEIKYNDARLCESGLGKLIEMLKCSELEKISKMLNFENIIFTTKKIGNDYTGVECPSSIFLIKYVKLIFQSFYNIKIGEPQKKFPDIEKIVGSKNIVETADYEVWMWYSLNKGIMTWEEYDVKNNVSERVKRFIRDKFDRTKKFKENIIIPDGYYQWYILSKRDWIKKMYVKYMKCNDYKKIREYLFYLLVFQHSMDTQHYFHIGSNGTKFIEILDNFSRMINDIEKYIKSMKHKLVRNDVKTEKWNILSSTEWIDNKNITWEIKCCTNITLKNIIKTIMCNVMNDLTDWNSYDILDTSKITINANYVNFLKGNEIKCTMIINSMDLREIISILQSHKGN
jgi:thymidine kinase